MAEGGAAIIFVGVARHAEVGVIAILLASACVIAGGEDMAVRRRTEPRVLIRRGQRDRVETVDFIAVADDLALGIAIPPAGARTLAADPGQAVIDMDKARGGHGGIAPRCAERSEEHTSELQSL